MLYHSSNVNDSCIRTGVFVSGVATSSSEAGFLSSRSYPRISKRLCAIGTLPQQKNNRPIVNVMGQTLQRVRSWHGARLAHIPAISSYTPPGIDDHQVGLSRWYAILQSRMAKPVKSSLRRSLVVAANSTPLHSKHGYWKAFRRMVYAPQARKKYELIHSLARQKQAMLPYSKVSGIVAIWTS